MPRLVFCNCGGRICGEREARYTTRVFRCAGCRRLRPWCFGSPDDMPDHCDDCWADAHPELAPAGTATPGTYAGAGAGWS